MSFASIALLASVLDLWGTPLPAVGMIVIAAAVRVCNIRQWNQMVEQVRAEHGELKGLRLKARLNWFSEVAEKICAEIETRYGAEEADSLRQEMAEEQSTLPILLRRVRWTRGIAIAVPWFLIVGAVTVWILT